MYLAKGIFFDLDGTLVDSFPDIAGAVNLTLNALDRPQFPENKIRDWVGNGSPTLIKRALTGERDGEPEAKVLEHALPLFFDLYAENIWLRSEVYPGVHSTLDYFLENGLAMACVTNKPGRHTELLLQATGLDKYFSCIVAGDTLDQQKPDPAPLQFAAKALGLTTSDCLMVGDSLSDILAGQAAAMPVLCLAYGYNQGLDLSTYHPDAMVARFSDLQHLVDLTSG